MQVRSNDESSAETLGSGAALWRTKHWRWKKKRARWRVVYTKVRAGSATPERAPPVAGPPTRRPAPGPPTQRSRPQLYRTARSRRSRAAELEIRRRGGVRALNASLAALMLSGCAASSPIVSAGTVAAARPAAPSQAHILPVCAQARSGFARCLELIRTDTLNSALPFGYGPADIQNAYDLPSASRGKGQTIAAIDSGDNPNAEGDLNQYRLAFGQPPCTTRNGCFAKLNQSGSAGNYPKADPGDGLEIDLDIEMVSATCPNCRIMLVESNRPQIADLAASVDTAVAKGANVVSNSYQVIGNA